MANSVGEPLHMNALTTVNLVYRNVKCINVPGTKTDTNPKHAGESRKRWKKIRKGKTKQQERPWRGTLQENVKKTTECGES